MDSSRDRETVNSVLKAFYLLEIISREQQIGISELTRKSGLKKTTVARLLTTLKKAGVVEQDRESQRFYLTIRVFELGRGVLENLDVRQKAQALIEEFVLEEKKSALLSLLHHNEVAYIGKFEAPELFRINTPVGGRAPVYCSGSGKAMLAFLNPQHRQDILENIELKPYTPKTITYLPVLEQDLAATRKRGYALDLEERHTGLFSAAAPIFDSQGNTVAAVSVPRMATAANFAEMSELGQKLVTLAKKISRQLGWST